LVVIPCLFVTDVATGRGLGRQLLAAIEEDARRKGRLGLTVTAYRGLYGAEWFMPAAYFETLGFEAVMEKGSTVLLWKPFAPTAVPPQLLEPDYAYRPVPGKVIVDLFWNGFCQTSAIEAQRVRDVAAEFEGKVVLNEYCAEDHEQLLCHQIPRAIYVNGVEIGWGYEAPREGIRRAIEQALVGAKP
jgi:hypothetical protein